MKERMVRFFCHYVVHVVSFLITKIMKNSTVIRHETKVMQWDSVSTSWKKNSIGCTPLKQCQRTRCYLNIVLSFQFVDSDNGEQIRPYVRNMHTSWYCGANRRSGDNDGEKIVTLQLWPSSPLHSMKKEFCEFKITIRYPWTEVFLYMWKSQTEYSFSGNSVSVQPGCHWLFIHRITWNRGHLALCHGEYIVRGYLEMGSITCSV